MTVKKENYVKSVPLTKFKIDIRGKLDRETMKIKYTDVVFLKCCRILADGRPRFSSHY